MNIPEILPKILLVVKWNSRDEVAKVYIQYDSYNVLIIYYMLLSYGSKPLVYFVDVLPAKGVAIHPS